MNRMQKFLDSRARRAAKRAGLFAMKARGLRSVDNHGGYALIDPYYNCVVRGSRFDLSAEEVIDICEEGPSPR
jgi:hypothetical protein